MANRWKIPKWLEDEVLQRDSACVYCGRPFPASSGPAGSSWTWEHIVNDARIVTRENIALACRGCNASKGRKPVSEWLRTAYCRERGITTGSVAPVIRSAIGRGQ